MGRPLPSRPVVGVCGEVGLQEVQSFKPVGGPDDVVIFEGKKIIQHLPVDRFIINNQDFGGVPLGWR